MPPQHGLEWIMEFFGLEPRWTKEPDIDIISQIAREHLGYNEETTIDVNFFAQGGFNKLYKVTALGKHHLMRVSLPVYPRLKTESEVATIAFIRENTDIPVTRVIGSNSDSQKELGFEWILVEMMPGVPLKHRWRKLSWQAKETLVRQLARYQAQLFTKRFQGIGNLFFQAQGKDASNELLKMSYEKFKLGPVVSHTFFWGDRLTHNVPKGPFNTSYDWLQARLKFALIDQEQILASTDDEDDIEDAQFAKDLAAKLAPFISKVFHVASKKPEPSVLFHDDMSMSNVLIDEDGRLTAIIDWECVTAVPLWNACQLPQLLEGKFRDEKPDKNAYAADVEDEYSKPAPESLDNEGINVLYWEHLLDYEKTQLRRVFIQKMEHLSPEWALIREMSTQRVDFEMAVQSCNNGWVNKRVNRWLEAYMKGDITSLDNTLLV